MNGNLESTKANGYYRVSEDELCEMDAYCARYMRFLEKSRTERATVANAVRMLEENFTQPESIRFFFFCFSTVKFIFF